MRYATLYAVAVTALIGCSIATARADDFNSSGGQRIVVTGVVVHMNAAGDRLAIRSDTHHRFNVELNNAEVVTPDSSSSSADDLVPGARVRVTGQRLGVGLVEADRVTVIHGDDGAPSDPEPVDANPVPPVVPIPEVTAAPTEVTGYTSGDAVRMEARVDSVMPEIEQFMAVGPDDKVFRVKAHAADIIVPRVNHACTVNDLTPGMKVRIVGEHGVGRVILADRIKVVTGDDDSPATNTVPPTPAPVITDISSYTGIIIDCRAFANVSRSMSPAIYGPDMSLAYPDRAHVPSPDEVQDESIVRYYRTQDAAVAGVGGSNPLILKAADIVGPGEDSVQLSAADLDLFQKLDARLHFLQTWKVGFLLPTDR